MRAVIYCRVSTTEQTLNLSLETQEQACRLYCRREGYAIDEVFVDAGESAKTANRPAFLKLLAHCRTQKGKVHAVIVYSLTRFSRNTADHHGIAALLRGLGVTLRSVTEPIDESPTGRLMEAVLAGVAQFDNDVRAARTVAGMQMALKKGRWVWQPPLGYRKGTRGGPSLEVDPETAPLIQQLFELAATGALGARQLRTKITAAGLRGRTGRPLARSRLFVMLKSAVYAGRLESVGWETTAAGDWAPIISEDLYTRVQRQLTPRRTPQQLATRHRNHPDFPLRRFIRCASCGRAVTGSWSRGRSQRYAHYHCVTGCTRVPKAQLEDAFLALLDRLKPTAEYFKAVRAHLLDDLSNQRDTKTIERQRIDHRITAAETKLAKLDHAFIYEERIDQATYARQRDLLREQLALLRLERQETDIAGIDLDGLLTFAEHALSHASAFWTAAATVEERMQVQATFFPDGVVWSPRHEDAAKRFHYGQWPVGDGYLMEPRNCLQFFGLEPSKEKTYEWWTQQNDLRTKIVAFLHHLERGLKSAA